MAAMHQVGELYAGEVGWMSGSIKQVADARVGDTITLKKNPAPEAYPGYKEAKPMVFCGLFPVEQNQVRSNENMRSKRLLHWSSLLTVPDPSPAPFELACECCP